MATVTQIGPRLGIAPTCAALGLPRATYYRRRRPPRAASSCRPSPRALSAGERDAVLTLLHEPRFVDHAPAEIYTPADVHHGLAKQRVATRATVLAGAYAAHPERFPGGLSQPPACPTEVWINRPKTRAIEEASYRPILAGSAVPSLTL